MSYSSSQKDEISLQSLLIGTTILVVSTMAIRGINAQPSSPNVVNQESVNPTPSALPVSQATPQQSIPVQTSRPTEYNNKSEEIVRIAKGWQDKYYKPGETKQCASFVRSVFRQAGVNLPVSRNPIDASVRGNANSPAMAQSLCGSDVGTLIKDKSQLKLGDIVAFYNTYGNFPEGSITHVGIYVGGGMMIDRSTTSKPVQYRSINTFRFAVGVRPRY